VKLHEAFKDKNLVILKVSIKDKEEDVKKYKNDFNVSSPLLIDDTAEVANAYGVQSHPETLFISRTGKIIGRAFGDKEWDSKNMRRLIDDLLKEK